MHNAISRNHLELIPQSVLHCASLRRTIFVSLASANKRVVERVHLNNIRDLPQAKLDREFLLNEHGNLYFLFHNFNENSIRNN